jgi:hypothetical protein
MNPRQMRGDEFQDRFGLFAPQPLVGAVPGIVSSMVTMIPRYSPCSRSGGCDFRMTESSGHGR